MPVFGYVDETFTISGFANWKMALENFKNTRSQSGTVIQF